MIGRVSKDDGSNIPQWGRIIPVESPWVRRPLAKMQTGAAHMCQGLGLPEHEQQSTCFKTMALTREYKKKKKKKKKKEANNGEARRELVPRGFSGTAQSDGTSASSD